MKAIKYVVWGVGGIVALVVLAIIAAVMVVDGGFVKSRAERYMKEEKQRTLKIEGTPALKLFPVFSLSLGKTSLSEPKSDKVFVALDSMQVAVKVMPLLSGTVSVDQVALSGLKANIIKNKEGKFNFDDLAGKKEDKPESDPPKVRVAAILIENAQIAYADEASGQRLTVGDVNVKAGGLADDQPGPLTVSANISGRKPEIALKLQVGGMAKMDLARQVFALAKLDGRVTGNADMLKGLDLRISGDLAADGRSQEYKVDGLNLNAKGMIERDALAAVFSAPKLRVTSSKAEGEAVTGSVAVKGPGRNVDLKGTSINSPEFLSSLSHPKTL